MTNWSLVTYRDPKGVEWAGVLRADGAIVQPAELRQYRGLMDAMDDWDVLETQLRGLQPADLEPLETAELVLSLRYPRKLICAGANYIDHISEMGGGDVPMGWRPFFFFVPPTTALIANGEAIEIADDDSQRVDWEAELAVVIGRRATRIGRDEALGHIAGYACLNDVTARAALRRLAPLADPFQWDWAEAKAADTFTPLGSVTPAWQVEDPNNLGIRCLVNGELKQDGSTRNFICDVQELVSVASHLCTLEPGDVIATGTPAGVGAARGEHLRDGDQVRVEIDGIAALENPVSRRGFGVTNGAAADRMVG